jgi:hypothetical protein
MKRTKASMGVTAGLVLGGRHREPGRFRAPHFTFRFKHLDKNGILLDEWTTENLVTQEGGGHLLDVGFDGATQVTTWYLGLISSVSYTAIAKTDTAAQIAGTNGWREAGASNAPQYDTPAGTNRGTIVFGEPTNADPVVLDSSSAVNFIFTEAGTLKGSFVASNQTRYSTSGVIYSVATFSPDKVISGDNDQINVTVSLSLDVG